MITKIISLSAVAAIAGGIALSAPTDASAATKLTLVYPFPDFLVYTKNCKALAAKINKRGKGVLEIEVLPFNSI